MKKSLPEVMKDLNMTEGFDVGLEMSGNRNAFESMLEAMHHGGRLALLGILPDDCAVEWSQVIFKGLILKGIYGREMFETWYKMAAMIQSGLGHHPRDHPPLRDRRLSEGLRCHAERAEREGDSGLGSTVVRCIAATTAKCGQRPHFVSCARSAQLVSWLIGTSAYGVAAAAGAGRRVHSRGLRP